MMNNYMKNAMAGNTSMSLAQATERYNKDMGKLKAGVPDSVYNDYVSGVAGGKITMSPEQALKDYRSRYQMPYSTGLVGPQQKGTPEYKHAQDQAALYKAAARNSLSPEKTEQLIAEANMEKATLLKQAEEDQQNLAFTGARINDGYVQSLNNKADSLAANSDKTQDFLKNQKENPGLKYQKSSNSFGTPEQATQKADAINQLYSTEKQQRADANTKIDADMQKWRDGRAADNASMKEQGIKDPEKAKADLARLTAQFNNFNQAQKPENKMRFQDFVKAKDAKEGIDPIVMGMISSNYEIPAQASDEILGKYSYGMVDMRNKRDKESVDRAHKEQQNQAARQSRNEYYGAQGRDIADEAKLIAKGYTPQQARSIIEGAHQMQRAQDFYASNNPERIRANSELQIAREKTQQERLIRGEEKAKEDNAWRAALYSELNQKFPGQNPEDTSTDAGRERESRERIRLGIPPINYQNISQSIAPGSKTPIQVRDNQEQVEGALAMTGQLDPGSPGGVSTLANELAKNNLSPREFKIALGRSLGKDLTNPDKAIETANEIVAWIKEDTKTRSLNPGSWFGERTTVESDKKMTESFNALKSLLSGLTPSQQEKVVEGLPTKAREAMITSGVIQRNNPSNYYDHRWNPKPPTESRARAANVWKF
jgi:hypothetical protein